MVTFANRAKVSTSTTGTGTITLGNAVDGYQSFSDAGLTGSDTVRYTIEDGDAWEIGTGGINAAVTTMSRTLIESSTGSKLSLSGDAVVYVTAAGQDIVQPSDLSTVATSGAYSDLSGLPTLGTAAAADTGDFATAAQGALADSAVQPNDSPSFGSVTVSGTVDGRDVASDGSKLDGIEAGATADQTAGEIKTAYESNANTNAYTDAEQSKLAGIASGAEVNTVDSVNTQTGAVVLDADDISDAATTNKFTTAAEISKLAGIEAGANVTDTANVTAAGALMDSEVTNLAQVKTFDSADYATAAQGSLADSALQSGDNVSALTNDAGYTTNVGDITGVTAGSGISGGGTSGTVTINHADTSSQGSVNNSGATVIQDVTVDTYGHVTGLGSKTLTAADVGAITGNQTITLSGDVSGSGTTSISVTVANDSHTHSYLVATDDRDMKPDTSGIGSGVKGIKAFFSTYGGMTGTADTDYQDVLVLDTYSDASGGNANAITLDKSSSAMRIWNAAQGATSWGTPQRVFADNYHPNADKWTTARTLSLSGDASGSVSWDGSANATLSVTVADDSHNHVISNVDGLQTALDGKLSTSAAYTNSDVDAHLNTSTATTDQVLSWTGSDYDWVDASAGAGFMSATNPVVTSGTITEDVYSISGIAPTLEPDNGSIQTHSLSWDTTYSDGLSEGQAITLVIYNFGSKTVTWPTMTWVNNGAIAPTLPNGVNTFIALCKVGGTLYGALVGNGS